MKSDEKTQKGTRNGEENAGCMMCTTKQKNGNPEIAEVKTNKGGDKIGVSAKKVQSTLISD